MKLSCHTITWGGVVGHPVGVTSVKNLFYLANGSTEQALADVAAAGYEGVELFDGNLVEYDERPEELERLLAETGLRLVGVYSGANFVFPDILEEEFWRIEKAAGLASRLGAEHLVVGGGAQRARGTTEEDYDRLAEALDRVVAVAEEHGLAASYHPHLSTIVEGPEQVEKILGRTRINFCPDTAHLAAAGGDPAELIRRYADRIVYVHLKDFTAEPFAFLPLGSGDLDLESMLDALAAVGYDGWLTVELDEFAGAPVDAARESRQYLDSLLVRTGVR
ncbi:MAG TPA: sugar phosphate isomerase/epimerase [Gaiellaceae bacterium]|nr:sugar phosphate isomerase/epimerase [Gaiellaceae bacterium]